MSRKNLLPVGSVVSLHEAEKKLMVIGILPINNGAHYDYLAVLYPEGFISEEYVFMFNHSDIKEVEFLGFMNGEYQVFRSELSKMAEDSQES